MSTTKNLNEYIHDLNETPKIHIDYIVNALIHYFPSLLPDIYIYKYAFKKELNILYDKKQNSPLDQSDYEFLQSGVINSKGTLEVSGKFAASILSKYAQLNEKIKLELSQQTVNMKEFVPISEQTTPSNYSEVLSLEEHLYFHIPSNLTIPVANLRRLGFKYDEIQSNNNAFQENINLSFNDGLYKISKNDCDINLAKQTITIHQLPFRVSDHFRIYNIFTQALFFGEMPFPEMNTTINLDNPLSINFNSLYIKKSNNISSEQPMSKLEQRNQKLEELVDKKIIEIDEHKRTHLTTDQIWQLCNKYYPKIFSSGKNDFFRRDKNPYFNEVFSETNYKERN